MNSIPFETDAIARTTLKAHYEAAAAKTLLLFWRRRLLLTVMALCGLLVGLTVLALTEKHYSSEAVFQIDFGRAKAEGPPAATVDSGVLVEGDARIIRSRQMGRQVALRLGLDKDPKFTAQQSIFSIIGKLVRGDESPAPVNPSVAIERATTKLMKQVTVSNDMRSYLITISARAETPEMAADIANTFAMQYLHDRLVKKLSEAEVDASTALNDLEKIYGDKHPSVVQAHVNLVAAREQLQLAKESPTPLIGIAGPLPSQLVSAAQPIAVPTGASTAQILGLCVGAGLIAGIVLALLLEKRDTGFRTAEEVAAHTGMRCLGMVPKNAKRRVKPTLEQQEALHAVWLAAGLDGPNTSPRIVMVTSSVPNEGKSSFVLNLANWRVEQGERVLIIDATPRLRALGAHSLEELLETPKALKAFFDEQRDERLCKIIRSTGDIKRRGAVASSAFDNLCKQALHYYDVVLIEAPAAIMQADNVALGKIADRSIMITAWNATPRKTVAIAARQLHEASVRISGIVLTGVDLRIHKTYRTGDQCYNFAKYKEFYKST